MNVFIIHSEKDAPFADQLATQLSDGGAKVWRDGNEDRHAEDNVLDRVTRSLDDIEVVLVLVSSSFTSASWIAHELSTWMFREALVDSPVILPLLIEDCEIPSFLADHACIDFRGDFSTATESLLSSVSALTRGERLQPSATMGNLCPGVPRQLERVRRAFSRGKLTLFCGAGVSMSAGIPGWKVFLRSLLADFFEQTRSHETNFAHGTVSLAKIYQDYFDLSPIIVAQYLKNALGHDFQRTVRDALYVNERSTSELIDSICELCRPQRERPALNSIVNFNFDDLIEQSLARNKIRYRAIYTEGQRLAPSELPIYHVHGFLPQDSDKDLSTEIVFAEDAYHSKFIDPFSWSNLTQLSQLNQNTCLFVGLGMTDPNLRRLLDVAMRKNPEKSLEHFIFKKRYDTKDLANHMQILEGIADADEEAAKLVRMAEILEERDCNNLGLNVIWVESFDEIPTFFHRVSESR